MTAFVLGGAYTTDQPLEKMTDEQLLTYIRVVFALPIGIALIQIFFLVFVFPYETPVMLVNQGKNDQLKKLMGNIYRDRILG